MSNSSEEVTSPEQPEYIAAIDLGSNSFHMVVAKVIHGELRIVDKLGEKVQLAADMVGGALSRQAIERGLRCLQVFKAHLGDLGEDDILRVVATNALRVAVNSRTFIEPAEQLLGCPVDVISGHEEARLVYMGVAHTQVDDCSRLVIDVGGGSTEIIVGRHFEPLMLDSVQLGCVAYLRFFPNGEINHGNFQRAYNSARNELVGVSTFCRGQWQNCMGCSGTLLAIEQVMIRAGLSQGGIERSALSQLKALLFEFDTIDAVNFQGLKASRRQVFASGLAITIALFDSLEIERMQLSSAALRDGVLYELMHKDS